jgi:DMSO/TMAO reductase YedYZ molybdopterin-dependent catalytic subunit
MQPVARLSKRSETLLGACAGVVAAGVALGVAELIAGLSREWRSPIVDVGDRVVDNVPPFVKDLAIEMFGTNDKVALLVGIGVLLTLSAAAIGAMAFRRRLAIGIVGIAAFGVIGALAAAANRAAGSIDDSIPVVVGAATATAALWTIQWTATRGERGAAVATEPRVELAASTRRELLVRTGGLLALMALAGAGAGAVGRAIRSRFSAAESRANVVLPRAVDPATAIPEGVEVGVDGITPFVTPNVDFYRIDTALSVPQVGREEWRLRVHGMVDREMTYRFADLERFEVVEKVVTLTCVSNPVGGDLVSNATWTGYRVRDLLAEAGIHADADMVLSTSHDGFTAGTPVEALTDPRDALLAIGMNGEPLPTEHGYPARLVVPGLYGYVSATKWVVDLELTRFDRAQAYWTKLGWSERGPIKTQSRIDVPRSGTDVTSGPVTFGGVAWAQDRGVRAVEVRIDPPGGQGEWRPATLGDSYSDDTWRLWSHAWEAKEPGRYTMVVRATDNTGAVQTEDRADPVPDGATGWHTVVFHVI